MSYLTQSAGSLQTQVIAALESETGLTFNRLTETVAKFYARCLGDSTAYLRKSEGQMLAELNTQFDGSAVSHLTMGYAQLLDTLDATLAGSGGGGGFHMDAIHLDGSTALFTNEILTTDSGDLSFVFIGKFAEENGDSTVWVSDPVSTYETFCVYDPAHGDPTTFRSSFLGDSLAQAETTTPFTPDVWHCVICTVKTNAAAGLKKFKMYDGDTDMSATFDDFGDGSFLTAVAGLPFFFAWDGFEEGIVWDVALFRFMPGISLLTGGDIAEATRRLFIDADGKPVDPAVATAELGAGCVLFTGDAASFGTNQGTGGAFSVMKKFLGVGASEPGPVSLPGAVVGQAVVRVRAPSNATADFESTISVNDQIQQISGDYTDANLVVSLVGGSLTNADSSPSD